MTPAQAIQVAISGEYAAAAFYRGLAAMTVDVQVRTFFEDMANVETHHAYSIERAESTVGAGSEQFEVPDVEAWPKWAFNMYGSLDAAIDLAITAENKAASFYENLEACFQGAVASFFRYLANTERMHATLLETQRQKLSVGTMPPRASVNL